MLRFNGQTEVCSLLSHLRRCCSLTRLQLIQRLIPMVGASGGIAGVLGAYLVLHPKAVIRTFLLFLIFIRFINLPAWVVLGIWIGGQFLAVPAALDSDGGGVAYLPSGGFLEHDPCALFQARRCATIWQG